MDKILTDIGVLLLIVGLVTGIAGMSLALYSSNLGDSPSWLVELIVGFAFLVSGGLIVILGIKKY